MAFARPPEQAPFEHRLGRAGNRPVVVKQSEDERIAAAERQSSYSLTDDEGYALLTPHERKAIDTLFPYAPKTWSGGPEYSTDITDADLPHWLWNRITGQSQPELEDGELREGVRRGTQEEVEIALGPNTRVAAHTHPAGTDPTLNDREVIDNRLASGQTLITIGRNAITAVTMTPGGRLIYETLIGEEVPGYPKRRS
jgi:hypothetical protein